MASTGFAQGDAFREISEEGLGVGEDGGGRVGVLGGEGEIEGGE